MIVCTCRNISTRDFTTEDLLKKRIMESDHKCGLCQQQYYNKDNNDEIKCLTIDSHER